MKTQNISIGSCYISERQNLLREVVGETKGGSVHWRSYYLGSGTPTGDSAACSRVRMLTWADREATPEEVARIDREITTSEQRFLSDIVSTALACVSDEQLLAEVHRRDLLVAKE